MGALLPSAAQGDYLTNFALPPYRPMNYLAEESMNTIGATDRSDV